MTAELLLCPPIASREGRGRQPRIIAEGGNESRVPCQHSPKKGGFIVILEVTAQTRGRVETGQRALFRQFICEEGFNCSTLKSVTAA